MGICITKLPHKTDKCNSSDALQVFENDDGTVSGFCFACDTYVPNPYGEPRNAKDIPKTARLTRSKEEIKAEIEEINECSAMDLPERRLRKDVLDKYGVKVSVSQLDGTTPRVVYFPYRKDGVLKRYKARLLGEKRIWNIAEDNNVDLFGWQEALESGARRLIITEGEYDALALTKILEIYTPEKWKDLTPAIVSLINGAGGITKDLGKVANQIRRQFKEVSLCFDNDEAGQKATEEALKILPYATVINLPGKDANDCLKDGKGKQAYAAATFNASKPKNSHLVLGSSLRDLARQRPKMGLSWPWEGFTKLTRGIRRGETYYFGAGVKLGKSELVNAIGEHLIVHHGLPVLFCKPEEDKVKTYQMLVGKAAGRIFHDPNIEFDEEAFDKAEPLIGDKAIIVDNYQFVNWDNLKDDIRYAVNNDGVKDIIIDPITCFTNGMSASDANEFLLGWAAELAAMSKDLDFTSYIFCHLKAPLQGLPHERGGEVMSTQFTGSRAMMRSCHMMVGLEGNKDPELPEIERNVRKLKILEDRNLGASGIVKLYWNNKTSLFEEMRN
jgi:twinkle protein